MEVIIDQTGMLRFPGLYFENWKEYPAGKILHPRWVFFCLT
jgi:hypothetical protein